MQRGILYGKRIISCLLFVICMILLNEGFRFLLVDDTESYTRITLHEMYEQNNIDVLFLGSSHSYRSIDPSVTDNIWGLNTFNAGTSSQQPAASYYLLKEVCTQNHLSKVYMEVYYDLIRYNEDYQSSTAAYIISDYMKPSVNRLRFIWDTGGKDSIIHGLILGRRYWENLFDPSFIRENLNRKLSSSYLDYIYLTSEKEDYAGKGFVYSREKIEEGTFIAQEPFSPIEEEALSEDNLKYLNKIISYCQEHEIELIFYSAPIPDFRLAGCGNYDSYIEQMEAFLEDKNVPYYDFNLCRYDALPLNDSCYKDNDHLNGDGAQLFSRFFAEFFAQGAEKETVFWNSYAEKLSHEKQAVLGIVCEQHKEEDGTISAHIIPVKTQNVPIYFAVYKRKENEDVYEECQPYSEETDFVLPADESGYFHIYTSLDPEGTQILNDAAFYYY